MVLAHKVSSLSPSPTLAITAKANRMKKEGIHVIGFGAGEPDFDTPQNIKEAAVAALRKGLTKYTPSSGIPELKEAIVRKFQKDNGLEYKPENIIVSCGAKHTIFNAVLALCEEGDEVLLPAPFWVSYPEMIKLTGAKTVLLPTTAADGFKVTAEQLKKAITPKTKLFILNSPSNPTGMMYSEKDLREIGTVLAGAGVWCLSDEIYEKLCYDGHRHVSIASLGGDIQDKTIVVNGVSKSYAMTGWRIGYAAGPKEVVQAMSNLQDHSTSNPTSISQWATVEALNGPQDEVERMRVEFQKRRDGMVQLLSAIPGLSVGLPQGAFYCFVDVSGLFGKKYNGQPIGGSLSVTDLLLTEARIAVVPGCVFGDDRCVRLSYATSMENIAEGLKRFADFVKKVSV